MKIVITESFEREFYKLFKYSFLINNLVEKLKTKQHTLINLIYPYRKFKYKIFNISIRWVVFVGLENKIVPIYIAKKKDKIRWYNIKVDKDFLKILDSILKNTKTDLRYNKYKVY